MHDLTLTKDLEKALRAGYIDSTTVARQEFKPKLLLNDAQNKTKVLTTILSELRTCDEFAFSVAFVTNSGVEVIIDALKELEHKNIKGRILASSYQNFTEPRALRRLLRFPNIELKIQTENNFHAKGYIFRHGEGHTLIVGSSNLTQNALCANNEWNLRVTSFAEGSIVSDIRSEFDRQFASATVVDEDWLLQYTRIYRAQRIAQIRARSESQEELAAEYPLGFRPSPNTMQKEALEALQVLRAEGQSRALLISATGTGKTYLSAFDASAFDAKRVLFVIHRENIARAAMRTFRTVFGNTRTMGFYGGSEHDTESDFIFTTVQTMSRPDHYTRFDPDTFDYICIDAYGIIGLNSKDSADKGFLKLSSILFSPQKRLMVDLRRKNAQNEDLSAKRSAACNFGSTVSDVVPSHLLQRQSIEYTPDVDLHRSTVRYPKDVSLACAA